MSFNLLTHYHLYIKVNTIKDQYLTQDLILHKNSHYNMLMRLDLWVMKIMLI